MMENNGILFSGKKILLSIVCLVGIVFAQANETQKVIEVVDNVGRYADEHRWMNLRGLFADKVVLDYSSFTKQPATTVTPDEIIKSWSGFLPGFEVTQHKNTDHVVKKDGDTFKVHTDVRAFHFISNVKDGNTWIVDGSYDVIVKKVKGEYKVSKFKFNFEKTLGNNNLPAVALERMQEKSFNAGKNRVEFKSNGKKLVGDLYLPKNYDSSKSYKTVIVNGSWTTVKEQMAGTYAQKLSDEGFITLAFDYRGYGESEGDVKYYESPSKKIEDINNAADFLVNLNSVEGIGVLGICAGAGYSLDSAAENPNIKAVVTAASWIHDGEAVKMFYGGEKGVNTKIKQAQDAKKAYEETGKVKYIPTISTTDKTAAMYGPFDYYLNPDRGAIKEWSNDKFAVASWEDWLKYDPTKNANKLDKPTLMIHSDGAVLPEYTKKYFANLKSEDKKLIWLGTELQSPMHQFKFYDNEKEMNTVTDNASKWFEKYL